MRQIRGGEQLPKLYFFEQTLFRAVSLPPQLIRLFLSSKLIGGASHNKYINPKKMNLLANHSPFPFGHLKKGSALQHFLFKYFFYQLNSQHSVIRGIAIRTESYNIIFEKIKDVFGFRIIHFG